MFLKKGCEFFGGARFLGRYEKGSGRKDIAKFLTRRQCGDCRIFLIHEAHRKEHIVSLLLPDTDNAGVAVHGAHGACHAEGGVRA